MAIKVTDQVSVPAASTKLWAAVVLGVLVGIIAGQAVSWKISPLVAWDVAALFFMLVTWRRVLHYDAHTVKKHALREDPSRVNADLILTAASVVSLVAVALVLTRGGGVSAIAQAFIAFASVVVSWAMIHTIYSLRYAELYYRATQGGIDFGEKDPVYTDFAYLAFTLGMTFQVSDTPFTTGEMRRVAIKHVLLSYLFGTVIIATTINLVAGLGQ
jgi:uncharacterized membrane protein